MARSSGARTRRSSPPIVSAHQLVDAPEDLIPALGDLAVAHSYSPNRMRCPAWAVWLHNIVRFNHITHPVTDFQTECVRTTIRFVEASPGRADALWAVRTEVGGSFSHPEVGKLLREWFPDWSWRDDCGC